MTVQWVIAARVSDERQTAGTSLEVVQLEECRESVLKDGGAVVAIVRYVGSGVKARSAARYYEQVREALNRTGAQRLLVWRIDRYGRNTREGLNFLSELMQRGVKIRSFTEGDLDETDIAQLLVDGQKESRKISQRVIPNMRVMAKTGHWVARNPWGLDLVPCQDAGCKGKRLAPNPDKAPIVAEIFRRADEGQTLTDIQRFLRHEHNEVRGLEWIKSQLTNEAYLGRVVYDRRQRGEFRRTAGEVITVEDAHEALIDRETFARVGARFRDPQRIARATSRPLDGLIMCSECQKPMYANKKGRHHYMRCSTHQKLGTCHWNQIPYTRVEAALEREAERFFPEGVIDQEYENLAEQFVARIVPEVVRMQTRAEDVRAKIEARIQKRESEQMRAFVARMEGGKTAELATRKIDDLEALIQQDRDELATVNASKGSDEWWKAEHRQLLARYRAYAHRRNTVEREVVRLLVNCIIVQAGTVVVEWTDLAHGLVVNHVERSPSRRPGGRYPHSMQ